MPNHWATGGESLWAKPLGDDLYEIHNIPFFEYGLNYLDVVKVDSSNQQLKPHVLEVIKPSGFSTLRICFFDGFDESNQEELFEELKQYRVEIERSDEIYVAVGIEPDGNYDAVYDRLTELEQNGVLDFETCESENPNDFDSSSE